MAAASAASPTTDHTIEPAIATDTPASAVTAHHGAVADAHVTSPTERMIEHGVRHGRAGGGRVAQRRGEAGCDGRDERAPLVDRILAHLLVTP